LLRAAVGRDTSCSSVRNCPNRGNCGATSRGSTRSLLVRALPPSPGSPARASQVLIGGRTDFGAAALADRVGADAGSLEQAAKFGDVVVLAVLYDGIDATLAAAGADSGTLQGRVMIDITNPVDTTTFLLRTPPGTSVAEQIAVRTGARVVKALHQVHGAVYLERARYGDAPLVVPMPATPLPKQSSPR